MKKVVRYITYLVLATGVFELSLRLLFGLGSPVLYIENPDYEYALAPNQDVTRFGNRILVNKYSMRSRNISPSDKIRILKLGDSIINGGSRTDHEELASTILENKLADTLQDQSRILNISAGSWGPDNAMAYINKHGDFGAGLFIMVFSSHDLYDKMTWNKIVDIQPQYPSEKPFSAIGELWSRYLFSKNDWKWSENAIKPDNSINSGWKEFYSYCKDRDIDLIVVLHPTLTEVNNGAYSEDGKTIISMLDSLNVPCVQELTSDGPTEAMYRDDLHYNEEGQQYLAKRLWPVISQKLNDFRAL